MRSAAAIAAVALFVLGMRDARAESGPGGALSAGQFKTYHEDVDRVMSEMLSKLLPQQAVRRIKSPQETAAPSRQVMKSPDRAGQAVVESTRRASKPAEPAIAAFADRFWNGRREDLRAALWRMNQVRPAMERILAEEGVPPQFAAVVLVESGANAAALSPKSARGLWQIIPETAERYGLVMNQHRDDRVDLVSSTRAAARYLRDLYRTFGNWRLALAAYNAGEGAIQRAVERAGSFNFELLSDRKLIPAETRNYVPAVLAAINLLSLQQPTLFAEVADTHSE